MWKTADKSLTYMLFMTVFSMHFCLWLWRSVGRRTRTVHIQVVGNYSICSLWRERLIFCTYWCRSHFGFLHQNWVWVPSQNCLFRIERSGCQISVGQSCIALCDFTLGGYFCNLLIINLMHFNILAETRKIIFLFSFSSHILSWLLASY